MRAKDLAKLRRHPAPAHPRRLPRAGRLRHAAVLQRRHHGRRGAQHPRALRPEVADAGAGAAPRDRGRAPRVRRPRQVRRRPERGAGLATLLSDTYAAERACQIDPLHAFTPPIAAGNVAASDGSCATPSSRAEAAPDTEGVNTTNLTVADKDGNVVEYTLTIEQTGGSGIVLPGRGFLLNNELTDFSAVYDPADPNRIEPRQAAAQLDVADDRAPEQEARARARVARRLDDHHHGARDPGQPARPRDVAWSRRSRLRARRPTTPRR